MQRNKQMQLFGLNIGNCVFAVKVGVFSGLAGTSSAMAHDERAPGIGGWLDHIFEVHTVAAWSAMFAILVAIGMTLYAMFLEPDFKKEERKNNRSNIHSGCSTGHDSGCSSGCGGCS